MGTWRASATASASPELNVARVRSHAAAVSGVHVMTDVSSDVLAAIVARSSVVWSMTGWGTPVTQDPAKCVLLCSQLARWRNKQ